MNIYNVHFTFDNDIEVSVTVKTESKQKAEINARIILEEQGFAMMMGKSCSGIDYLETVEERFNE